MINFGWLHTSLFFLLGFIISKTIALNEILPENQFRIELIAIQDFLWHEIEENQNMKKSSLAKKVVQFHDQFLFSNASFFMLNTSKSWMFEISKMPQWIEIEEKSSQISHIFQNFLDTIKHSQVRDIEEGAEYIKHFVETEIIPNFIFLNDFLDKMVAAMNETFRLNDNHKHMLFGVSVSIFFII